jgi:hypothetical protein
VVVGGDTLAVLHCVGTTVTGVSSNLLLSDW